MRSINNVEPAFPAAGMTGRGMSLRDYFAAKAVAGLMTRVWNEEGKLTGDQVIEQWATAAYAVADAMLKAREVQP